MKIFMKKIFLSPAWLLAKLPMGDINDKLLWRMSLKTYSERCPNAAWAISGLIWLSVVLLAKKLLM